MTLEEVAGGDGVPFAPKFGDAAAVFGSPVPEPNEPEHAATAAPRTTQAATAVETRARLIPRKVRVLRRRVRRLNVYFGAFCQEFRRLLRHAALALGVVAHVLRDLHGAEMRPAHRAEVRDLRAVRGQRLVVELLRGVGIEAQ